MRSTRPRKFTGASTNLQRCKLLLMDLLTGSELRGDESRAFWNQDRLVTELAQSIQGQAVITREEWILQPGGREFVVERLVKVEHGYTARGTRSYNTAKDTFVKTVR